VSLPTNATTAAALYDLLRARRSIRRYTPQAVPTETVERLLTAAGWAPSSHNRQPWRFAALTDSEPIARLARAMGDQLQADRLADGDAPADVAADAAKSFARITQAPVVIVVCLTLAEMDTYPDAPRAAAERTMAIQSVAMAVQNLLLAAHAEGLGACWMCAPLFCQEVVCRALDLPADWEAQALVTLGYPASNGKPATRRPIQELMLAR
jgi:coenzyme F420-0:L-glutamate ligase/coenzyme F420-1:gamma-L-glutamate ligase